MSFMTDIDSDKLRLFSELNRIITSYMSIC